MYYGDTVIEEVRQANDIVDVIGQTVKLTKKGSKYFGLCPFHNEKTPSFSVSPDTQLYYCFGCGNGGNAYTFVMEYENYSFQEAVEYLARRAGIELPAGNEGSDRQEDSLKKRLLEIQKQAARYFYYQLKGRLGQRAWNYLTGRGLTEETIRQFGLGYSLAYSDDLYQYLKKQGYSDELLAQSGLVRINEKGSGDKFWNRVMFPIMDVNGRVIGFGGRVMGEGQPKYLNSPETILFDKSRNLYGLQIARKSRKDYMLVCEGYMDVISLHQAGFTNAVASLGTAFTQQHGILLKRYVKQVVLTYDSDQAGVKAALRAIPILRQAGLSVKVLDMQPYKDPDEFIQALGTEAFQQRIDQAQNSFLYKVQVMKSQYDDRDPDQKTAFQNAVARELLEFQEEMERNNYIEAVSRLFQMDYNSLKRLVNTYGANADLYRPQAEEGYKQKQEKKNQGRETGNQKAQTLLLGIMISDENLYRQIRKFIQPEDFTDPLLHKAAELLIKQMDEGKAVKPAELMNSFINDEQDYQKVSAIFHQPLEALATKEDGEKAVTELVRKVKQYSLEQAGRTVTDLAGLQEILKIQSSLNELHISL